MKAYGGTCPMCCGDADGVAACLFCGFLLDGDATVRPSATVPVLSQPDAAGETLALPSASASAAAPSSLERLPRVG